MSIFVILSFFDTFYGPKVFITLPNKVSEETEKEIAYYINLPSENKFIETISKEQNTKIIHLPFTIDSEWARGNKEQLLFSLMLSKNYKSEIFEQEINKVVEKLQNTPNIYKAFYKEHETFSLDPDLEDRLAVLKEILEEAYQELNQILKEISLGYYLVLGLAKAGKSSILETLRTDIFKPDIKPTLASDVIQVILEKYSFRAIDVSGQQKLRYQWWERVKKPDAIIFVIDGTHNQEKLEETKVEFNKILDRYEVNAKYQLPQRVPILICINKIDLLENIEEKKEEIRKFLDLENCSVNYKVQLTSAKTGEGIKQGFKWIFQELLKIA